MSVIIKGMEMPDNCHKCAFLGLFLSSDEGGCLVTGEIIEEHRRTKRSENCPPSSGRLMKNGADE